MHVTIIAEIDEGTGVAGGTQAYVQGLAGFLASQRIPHLLVSAGTNRLLDVDRHRFPIRRRGSALAFQLGMCANLGSIPIPPDTIVHAQRPETLLPFVVAQQRRGLIVTLHGNPARAVRERRGRLVGVLYRQIERFALRTAHRVIAVDKATGVEYLTRFPWLGGRVRVISNAVDERSFHPEDRAAAKKRWGIESKAILYAGRLEPEKRVVEVVNAFRSLRADNVTLLIAGDGTQRPAIEAAAQGLPVRMLGMVDRADMPTLLNAADALVLYSEREGLPTVVLEALACGTPVITSPVGDLPGVVREGETGYVVSSKEELVNAMMKVRDGVMRPSTSIATSVSSYDWQEIGRRVVQVYRELWQARVR